MIQIVVNVTGNKEVEAAIAIVIAESRSRGPIPERHARFLGNVGERSIMIVVIEAILAEVGDVEIGPAVVVKIAHHRTKPPAIIRYAGLLGDIRKGSVVIVVEEGGVRRSGLAGHRVIRGSVY
jgi:hypothetical protein